MIVHHGITLGLLEDDRRGVEALLRRCSEVDGCDDAFFLDAPCSNTEAVTSFGVVAHGEVISFAHLPDDPEPEAGVMVRPDVRRRGLARMLATAMREEARRRGLNSILMVTNAESEAGRAFLAALGAGYEFSEYRLEHRVDTPNERRHPALTLTEANPDDSEVLTRIRAAAFGDDLAETRDAIARRFTETNRRYFLGVLAGEPIGVLRTGAWPDGADITSFGVLPDLQGLGYGRQLLRDAVALLRGEGWERITIEVATENERALGLYRSCGFEVIARYDYHRLTV